MHTEEVGHCMLPDSHDWRSNNYIPEPIKHTKPVFSAILLRFARRSDWDHLMHITTELPASFLSQAPRLDV